MGGPQQTAGRLDISVRPLRENEVSAADGIMRLAFGTFLGLREPTTFRGDAGMVRPRWLADPSSAFAAEAGGELVGSNFATNWGSVGFFGPLSIRPDLWDRGIGTRLMQPIMQRFADWGTRHAGLFTFAQSQKHVGLYQRFGFWPRYLTAIMAKPVVPADRGRTWAGYSELAEDERDTALGACRELTDAIYEGLDVTGEIRAILAHELGETILIRDGARLAGLAACHCGPGTEAGSGACYIKFGAVRPGPAAPQMFEQLLDACEQMAAARSLSRLVAGINTSRHEAYGQMLARGFRTAFQGVAMHRPNEPAYNRPGIYLLDDWR